MPNYICVTCGVQYTETRTPSEHCLICEDERQYVGLNGQQWTTLDELRTTHKNVFRDDEPGLTSLATEPRFAIGQRCFHLRTPAGNLLWECITLLDGDTERRIRE